VRAFRSVGGDPLYIVRGQGSHIWDADGNEYVDYIGSWGPLILGHAAPKVIEAMIAAARNGTSFGASTPSRSRSGRAGNFRVSAHAKSSLRQFGHRSDHVGDPPGARIYRAQIHCEV
jgi:acetylornithine/succinyldiaminopimelate/putrescine aminotransferase